jgi:aminopeptidase N
MTPEGLLRRARRAGIPILASSLLLCTALFSPLGAQPGPFAPPDTPPQYAPQRQYDLQHLRLELAFDLEAGTLAGTATNTLTPLLPGLDHLVFHAAELDIRRVHLAGSEQALPFAADPKARTVTVQLGRAYGPQDRLDVVFEYSAKPRAGLYFVRPDRGYPDKPRQVFSQGEPDLNRHWFPSWDYPNDRTTTELLATVAKPYQVIGNGKLLEVRDQPGNRRTYHWKMDFAHTTYLVSVIAGEFVKTADEWKGIPLEYYVPRELADRAPLTFARTPAMIDFFSQVTGRAYPYSKYAQTTVYDYMWGGMENISATTLTTRTLRDKRGVLDSTSEGLVAHEIVHQWFGNLLTCENWAHLWLNEGFADYFEVLFTRHADGEDEADWEVDTMRKAHLNEADTEYRRPLVTYRFVDPITLFDDHSYEKGALVLHMIRFLAGEEGWWKGIREYVARYEGRNVTTPDFQSVMEDAAGLSLQPLLDQYVYAAGHPELDLRWDYRPDTRLVRLEVHQKQRQHAGDTETGLFSFPVEIALIGEDGTATLHRVPVEAKAVQDLYLPSDRRPRTVVFDPKGWILKTVDFDKPAAEWIVQLDTARTLAAKLEALRALGRLGGPEAVAALDRTLRQAPFFGVRATAAEALGEIGTGDALTALRAATGDKEARVRTAVFKALASFPGQKDLIPVLRKTLETDESYATRAAAATALGRMRAHRNEVAPILTQALSQSSYQDSVRGAAIKGLAELGAPQAYEQALQLSRYGAPFESRDEAVDALVILAADASPERRQEIRRHLEGFLDDPEYVFRSHLFGAVGNLGDPASLPALERSLRAEAQAQQSLQVEKAIRTLHDRQASSREGEDLRQRIEQLEREIDVLKERLRGLEEVGAVGGGGR